MLTDPVIRDACINAVAVASIAYQEELGRLRYVLSLAAEKGLPVSEIANAAGLPCEQVATLVNQGEL